MWYEGASEVVQIGY